MGFFFAYKSTKCNGKMKKILLILTALASLTMTAITPLKANPQNERTAARIEKLATQAGKIDAVFFYHVPSDKRYILIDRALANTAALDGFTDPDDIQYFVDFGATEAFDEIDKLDANGGLD